MSRKLTGPVIRLVAWTSAAAVGLVAAAQPAAPETQPRVPRPQAGANVQMKVDPKLMQLLQQWSQASAGIQKLEGKHRRFVYDTVFATEKRAEGHFHHQAPDKGRIDLKPAVIAVGEVSRRKDKNGKPFTLKPDIAERWICNGREVRQINDEEKTADVFPIPDKAQGANIMDGPLPFLFGMPPEKAIARYDMTLDEEKTNAQLVWLEVKPRWQQDAANWQKATVILNRTTFLPTAVQLLDPTGNTETVYTFLEIEVNKEPTWLKKLWGNDDPFEPKLAGYKINVMNLQQAPAQAQGGPPQQRVLPLVKNFPYLDAKNLLKRANCEVVLAPGAAAPQAGLAHVVEAQDPPAGTPLKAGMKVTLKVYVAGDAAPALDGYHWEDAKLLLESAGYVAKIHKGEPTNRPEQVFTVQKQEPQAGTPTKRGDAVSLYLYTKPAAAAAEAPRQGG